MDVGKPPRSPAGCRREVSRRKNSEPKPLPPSLPFFFLLPFPFPFPFHVILKLTPSLSIKSNPHLLQDSFSIPSDPPSHILPLLYHSPHSSLFVLLQVCNFSLIPFFCAFSQMGFSFSLGYSCFCIWDVIF